MLRRRRRCGWTWNSRRTILNYLSMRRTSTKSPISNTSEWISTRNSITRIMYTEFLLCIASILDIHKVLCGLGFTTPRSSSKQMFICSNSYNKKRFKEKNWNERISDKSKRCNKSFSLARKNFTLRAVSLIWHEVETKKFLVNEKTPISGINAET